MRLRILSPARLETLDAADFYESRSEGLGTRFLSEIDRGIKVILQAPRKWPQPFRGFHRYRIDPFPYGIFYKVLNEEIVIVAVADLRRRPGYWLKRWRD